MPDCPIKDHDHETGCIFAQKAADQAVKKTFAIMGVDVDKPEQVESFRESLRFGDKIRKAADKGFLTFVSAVVFLILAALVTGMKFRLGVGG